MKNSTWSKCKIGIYIALIAIAFATSACSDDNKNANVGVQFGGFSTAGHKARPTHLKWMNWILPEATASVSSLKFCFKRLRFKPEEGATSDPTADTDNLDFDLGEVTIDAAGTFLGNIQIPTGVYRRVEFDLENHCASGQSIQLLNGNGTFSTTSRITIKFSGSLDVTEDGTVTLNIQNILDQLNSFNGGDLKVAAEALSGSF